MKLAFLLLLFLFIFFSITTLGIGTSDANRNDNDDKNNGLYQQMGDEYLGRWYGEVRDQRRTPLTCDRYPKVCNFPGSLGPDCCRRYCVDLRFDPFNCGRCGQRCGYGQMCCNGRCVNLLFDQNNCGWCNNRCAGEGSFCRYGMCSYA